MNWQHSWVEQLVSAVQYRFLEPASTSEKRKFKGHNMKVISHYLNFGMAKLLGYIF
jgi:hypothetical protein